ncbi:hypothetical protein M5K25_014484 [Dendrobium thyrsiflorum]|uniref:Uncharacterized protein n=1 Tax=Dendrobium thyrsiflorum TaxID=117978 RepID=A0ABD0UVV6_DENTH
MVDNTIKREQKIAERKVIVVTVVFCTAFPQGILHVTLFPNKTPKSIRVHEQATVREIFGLQRKTSVRKIAIAQLAIWINALKSQCEGCPGEGVLPSLQEEKVSDGCPRGRCQLSSANSRAIMRTRLRLSANSLNSFSTVQGLLNPTVRRIYGNWPKKRAKGRKLPSQPASSRCCFRSKCRNFRSDRKGKSSKERSRTATKEPKKPHV